MMYSYVHANKKLIDSDTAVLTVKRLSDNIELHLVMSDEFNDDYRRFDSGSDDKFEAIHKPDSSNDAIQFCKLVE